MSWETYQKAYANTTPELQGLLDSEKIPVCVKNALEKRGALSLRGTTVLQISSYIVSVQNLDETVKNLTQAGISDSLQFMAEIQTCINQPANATLPQQEQPALASEIKKTEHDLAMLQPVRTMPHDMAAIKPRSDVAYQSSQEDILNRSAPQIPLAEAAPRWDTDTRPQ